jgi:flagellar hook-associated protein 1 FlgK
MTFNAQHDQGVDAHGDPGTDFFSLGTPAAKANSKNTGTAALTGTYSNVSQITASDYTIKYSGGNYTVTRNTDGTQVYSGDGTTPPFAFDGITMTATGTPADGDTFTFQPTRDAARDLKQVITEPDKIAASSTTNPGSTNGNNALALAKLQTARNLAGNSLSLTEAYSQIVNTVGQQASAAAANDKAQDSVVAQRTQDQQSVSGVNLNEEYVSLSMYTQQYQAASKIIDVANTVFDTLLGLK